MTELPIRRSKVRISKKTALRMLGRDCLRTDINPALLEKLFAQAFERIPEGRSKQQRNIDIFKRYWGFTDGKPVYLQEIADEFGICVTRTHEILNGPTKSRLFADVRKQYGSRKRLSPVGRSPSRAKVEIHEGSRFVFQSAGEMPDVYPAD